jgi:hypothetical protein
MRFKAIQKNDRTMTATVVTKVLRRVLPRANLAKGRAFLKIFLRPFLVEEVIIPEGEPVPEIEPDPKQEVIF